MGQSFISSITQGFRTLVFDSSCIGCGQSSTAICESCRVSLRIDAERLSGETFPIYSGIPYGDAAAHVVLAAKEDGNRLARNLLTTSIVESLELLISEWDPRPGFSLVPIPSSGRSIRRRGGDFLTPIINDATRMIRDRRKGIEIDSHKSLNLTRRVRDQSKLTATERIENLRAAFEFSGSKPNWPIVVIDDVVTTGSTLREALRALQERNLTVVGAVTACASRRRMRIR
jgi:predicted amidophosphoribosyltransferase